MIPEIYSRYFILVAIYYGGAGVSGLKAMTDAIITH
jgi:hypothetical protein